MQKKSSDVDFIVGQNIHLLRQHIGMSQETLGERLGITFQQVQKYEKGTNRVSAGRLYAIAGIFGVSIADMFKGADETKSGETIFPQLSTEAIRFATEFQKIPTSAARQAVHNVVKAIVANSENTEA